MPLRAAEGDIAASAATATATSLPTRKPGTSHRPPSVSESGGRVSVAWRLRRVHALTLAGVLVAAAALAFVLASSSSSPPALTYAQFLHDVSVHEVKSVALAPSAGGTSSGMLTNGSTFRVAIPSQAGQPLLDALIAQVPLVAGASSSGSAGNLAYSQFLSDVTAHDVKTVDLAPSAGEISSGTLVNGARITVVIPLQAGQSLLTELHENDVRVTGASSWRK